MKKQTLNLGKALSRTEQKSINGGGDDIGGGCGRRCGTNNDCWGDRICSSHCPKKEGKRCRRSPNS